MHDRSLIASLSQALRSHFPPEFLNRLDDVVLFKVGLPAGLLVGFLLFHRCVLCSSLQRLRAEDMPSIVDIQVAGVRDLLKDRKITLDVRNFFPTFSSQCVDQQLPLGCYAVGLCRPPVAGSHGLRPDVWRTSS
jgi:hypothetical protein